MNWEQTIATNVSFLKGSQTGSHYPEPGASWLWQFFHHIVVLFTQSRQTFMYIEYTNVCLFMMYTDT